MSKNKNQQPTTFSLYACYRFLVEDVDSGHYPAPPVKTDVEVLGGSADELLYDAMINADIVNLDGGFAAWENQNGNSGTKTY